MELAPEVQEIEAMAKAAEVPMHEVLKRAGVASTTYWRWRNTRFEPHTRTIRKLKAALAELSGAA